MKKTLMTLVAVLFAVTCLFAGTAEQDLLAGVYNFATTPSSTWKIYDGNMTSIDVDAGEYTFTGGFVVKLLTFSRYDFTCTVKTVGNDFSVNLSNVRSYACDKSGNRIPNGSVNQTSPNVSNQYAAQMKTEIQSRIDSFKKAGTIDKVYFNTISNPVSIDLMSKSMTDLQMQVFLDENVNGKNVEFDVVIDTVEQNKNPLTGAVETLPYKARGSIEYVKESSPIVITDTSSVTIYSANSKLLSAKKGSVYHVNGKATVKKLGSFAGNTLWGYSVEE